MGVTDVLSGRFSIRQAAVRCGLPKSTIGFYVKRHHANGLVAPSNIKRPQHVSQIIPAALEENLSNYLKDCSIRNHGLSTIETRDVAYSFVVANKIAVPNNWNEKERAFEDWLTGFMKRNKSISIRKAEATSQARAAGCNKPVVMQFYDNLSALMVKHNFKPSEIYNADETNDPTVNQPPKVIAPKGMKQVSSNLILLKSNHFFLDLKCTKIVLIILNRCSKQFQRNEV